MDPLDLDRVAHLNFAEFFREACRFGSGGVAQDEGGVLLWTNGTDFPVMANGVMRIDDTVPADEVLERARDFFAPRRRGYTVFVRDGVPADDELAGATSRAGWPRLLDMPEMICPRRVEERPTPDGADITWVRTVDDVHDFARMNSAAYSTVGMPPEAVIGAFAGARRALEPHLRAAVARVGGETVSGAMVNLSHGIGGVYWVGTVDKARGTGLADACTRAVTNWAFDQGARAVSLQASSMGEPIYRRMGYADRYRYYGYVAPVPEQLD